MPTFGLVVEGTYDGAVLTDEFVISREVGVG